MFDAMQGKLEFIGIRPERKAEVMSVERVAVSIETGLEGDHYSKEGGKRQVTLIGKEGLEETARILETATVHPAKTRRNLLISGLDLREMLEGKIQIGEDVVLEVTGKCFPCARMDQNLGAGGLKALGSRAGVTARVVSGGEIKVGDVVAEAH